MSKISFLITPLFCSSAQISQFKIYKGSQEKSHKPIENIFKKLQKSKLGCQSNHGKIKIAQQQARSEMRALQYRDVTCNNTEIARSRIYPKRKDSYLATNNQDYKGGSPSGKKGRPRKNLETQSKQNAKEASFLLSSNVND